VGFLGQPYFLHQVKLLPVLPQKTKYIKKKKKKGDQRNSSISAPLYKPFVDYFGSLAISEMIVMKPSTDTLLLTPDESGGGGVKYQIWRDW